MEARELKKKLEKYDGEVKIVNGMLVAETGYPDGSYDILLREEKGDE